jgi:hypothetical protein
MNIIEKIYHFLVADILFYLVNRPALLIHAKGFDVCGWAKALQVGDRESAARFSDCLAELAEQANAVSAVSCNQLITHAVWTHSFAEWVFGSQRIFAPSAELVRMLLNTRFPDVTVGETKHVFDTYVIQLEEPIVSRSGHKHNLIFVTFEEGAVGIVSVQADQFARYQPMPDEKLVDAVARYVASYTKGAVFEGKDSYDEIRENLWGWRDEKNSIADAYCFETSEKHTYLQVAGRHEKSNEDGWLDVLKLIVGLNLYLQTNRADDNEAVSKPLVGVEGDCSLLLKGATLFELAVGQSSMSHPSISDVELYAGRNITPHFRMGHWRHCAKSLVHPEGLVVWVRPTLVVGHGTMVPPLSGITRGLVQRVRETTAF